MLDADDDAFLEEPHSSRKIRKPTYSRTSLPEDDDGVVRVPPAPEIHELRDDSAGELLKYYRSRIAAFEQEREEFLARSQTFDGSLAQLAELKVQLAEARHAAQEAKRALGDAHVFLYEEREEVLRLSAENDELRFQSIEDKKRIQHLLAMTRPVSQEVTYFRDAKPQVMHGFPGGVPSAGGAGGATVERGGAGRCDPHVIRTVYLPSDGAEALAKRVQELKKQLAERTKLQEDQRRAYEEDRQARERDVREWAAENEKRLAQANEETLEARRLLQMTTRDYLKVRHEAKKQERSVVERLATLESHNAELRGEAFDKRRKKLRALAKRQGRAKNARDAEVENLRNINMNREEDLAMMREQYAATQRFYRNRMDELESELAALKKKHHALQTQRNLEFEGYTTELKRIRESASKLEELLIHLKVQELHKKGAFDEASRARHNRWELSDSLQVLKGSISRVARKLGYLE